MILGKSLNSHSIPCLGRKRERERERERDRERERERERARAIYIPASTHTCIHIPIHVHMHIHMHIHTSNCFVDTHLPPIYLYSRRSAPTTARGLTPVKLSFNHIMLPKWGAKRLRGIALRDAHLGFKPCDVPPRHPRWPLKPRGVRGVNRAPKKCAGDSDYSSTKSNTIPMAPTILLRTGRFDIRTESRT